MLVALSLLPLTAVLIQDVRAESTASAVTVDVATSEPVSRADVRGVVGGSHRIYVYVQGTTAARPAFGSADQPIIVYPRARYTKLEVPTPSRCAEPMLVEPTPSGIRVRAACGDEASTSAVAPPVQHAVVKPFPEAPLAAKTRNRVEDESLRAALALPTEAARGDGEGAADEENAPRPDKAKAEAKGERATKSSATEPGKAGPAVPPAPIRAASNQPDAPLAAPGLVDSTSAPGAGHESPAKSSSSMASTFLAGALLVGLAIAAVLFARRRTVRTRMIKIVETASIGPRRSLVVANVAGRTMVLGVSEAGVALLDAQIPPSAIEVPAAKVASEEPASPLEQAVADLRALASRQSPAQELAPEDKHESSLLSRLFHRQAPAPASSSRDFEELLSESLEDQELRRKLSLGVSGRVA